MEVNAIDDVTVGKLYEAAASFGTKEMQDRNKILLAVFEHTGASVHEALNLTTASVLNALNIAGERDVVLFSRLNSRTSPGGAGKRRSYVRTADRQFMLVPKNIVIQWAEYIHTSRASCVKKAEADDDCYLLVDTKTGEKLTPNSVAQIMQDLSEAAGLAQPVTVRMIRDRFILKLCAVELIQYCRTVLENAHKFTVEHSSDEILKHYLNLNHVSSRRHKD